jgi:hypothetical protein
MPVMKLIRQTVALLIWLAVYVPTTLLVALVMLNVVLKQRSQAHAPNLAH